MIRYAVGMTSPDEQRINDLEMRLSYQDRLLGELDEVVRAFSRRVERLERQLGELQDSVGPQEIGPADEKPPHY